MAQQTAKASIRALRWQTTGRARHVARGPTKDLPSQRATTDDIRPLRYGADRLAPAEGSATLELAQSFMSSEAATDGGSRKKPIYESAPDDPTEEIRKLNQEIMAVQLIQKRATEMLTRRNDDTAGTPLEEEVEAALDGAGAPGSSAAPASADDECSPDEDADGAEAEFVVRNLDTGESISVALDGTEAAGELPPTLTSKLSFGTLAVGTSEWEAGKAECRGLLEKLASKSTLSFRSYQLCVWQERYVYAEDDALCYQQLSKDRVPSGRSKRIPYSSIDFIGPYDETQFVVMCRRRSYTFLAEDTEIRTRWIKSLSRLAGCSASTEVCLHTTRRIKGVR